MISWQTKVTSPGLLLPPFLLTAALEAGWLGVVCVAVVLSYSDPDVVDSSYVLWFTPWCLLCTPLMWTTLVHLCCCIVWHCSVHNATPLFMTPWCIFHSCIIWALHHASHTHTSFDDNVCASFTATEFDFCSMLYVHSSFDNMFGASVMNAFLFCFVASCFMHTLLPWMTPLVHPS